MKSVKVRKSLSAVVLAVVVAVVTAGCGFAGGGERITLGHMNWDENVANASLLKVILEDELGYERVELRLIEGETPLDDMFAGLSEGEIDAFTDVWMPNHTENVKQAGDSVELSEEPWYEGKTNYGLAVPDYMDTNSIAGLNSSGADVISGIEAGLPMMEKISRNAIPEYDLKLGLVEGPTPAMLADLDQRYRAREPIVFLAWSPHWMNDKYDFHYLEDPRNTLGDLDEPSSLHTVFREGFSRDDPVAYALINAMRLDEKQIGDIELAIQRAPSPEEGARDWLEDNREAMKPWIEAARRAES